MTKKIQEQSHKVVTIDLENFKIKYSDKIKIKYRCSKRYRQTDQKQTR